MKKVFIALSVLAVVAFMIVPCQALEGMPDAVPGSKTIVPFWLVTMDGAVGDNNTLVTLTEVEGVPATQDPVLDPPGLLHVEVFSQRSKIVHNEWIPYTKYDVVGIDFGELATHFSQAALDDCAIDFDGDGTPDSYLGYAIVTDVNYNDIDHWIAHLYQLDLGGGLAAGVVIPSKENAADTCAQLSEGNGITQYEAFNGDAYMCAKSLIADTGCSDALNLRLMPRYYIHDATGLSYLIVWMDQNLFIPLGAAEPFTVGGTMHINWFDEEEHKYSADLDIPNEVNIINIEYWLPGSLKGDYPYAGWCDMDMPSSFIAGTPWTTQTEMLAYSWQMAQAPLAAQSWSVMFEVHRDAGTTD